MTVAEMITELQKLPPDVQVLIDTADNENQPVNSIFLVEPKEPPQFVCIDCTP